MKILVGVNGGEEQADALALAARLARVEGGRLIVAHAYPWSRVAERLDPPYEAALREEAAKTLGEARERLGATPCETRLLPTTSAPRALQDLARDAQVDVLVVGSSHRGRVRRAMLGGVTERVIPGSTCPVAVAPRGYAAPPEPLRRIGVAYDGRPESDAAVEWARDLALRTGASVTLLQAVSGAIAPGMGVLRNDSVARSIREEAERSVEAGVRRLSASVAAEGRVLDGPAAETIAEAASGLDLLIAGSRGYGPVGALLLGSTSRGLIHESSCPVMVLPRTTIWEPEAVGAVTTLATSG